jgi:cytochrome b561
VNTPSRYHPLLVGLHWLLALALLAQCALGFWMDTVPKAPPGVRAAWFNLHKSWGMVLGVLILLRLTLRLGTVAPAWPAVMGEIQRGFARWGHAALYVCMLVVPISGFLGSTFSPYPVLFLAGSCPDGGRHRLI